MTEFITVYQAYNILLILCAALVLTTLLSFFNRHLLRIVRTSGVARADGRIRTLSSVVMNAGAFIISVMTVIMILRELRIDPTPILASAGIIGLAISFGAQELVKNVFAGLCILLENQYAEGDQVKLDDIEGCVEQLTLRKTVIKSTDGTLHHIPHGQIKIVSVRPFSR